MKIAKIIGLISGLIIFSLVTGLLIEKEVGKINWKNDVAIVIPTGVVNNKETVEVIRVIDGDTIEIAGGQKVRYIGVDTPETVDPKRPVGCFGKKASAKNKELVEGKTVELEKDVSNTDKYGRLLRYVWVGDRMINEELITEGYAKLDTVPPDVKYSQLLIKAEKEARISDIGLWSKCP
ncbi:MAG: thermonuclease family protein [Candidatus Shapirobacteria bacterium]|nr:thermonuclease family protein [Candidatus Shapirobacteria bacterium]